MGFTLCDGYFDRIGVRTVGWQQQINDPLALGLLGGLGSASMSTVHPAAPPDSSHCERVRPSPAPIKAIFAFKLEIIDK
jgi:hypothetical protein